MSNNFVRETWVPSTKSSGAITANINTSELNWKSTCIGIMKITTPNAI